MVKSTQNCNVQKTPFKKIYLYFFINSATLIVIDLCITTYTSNELVTILVNKSLRRFINFENGNYNFFGRSQGHPLPHLYVCACSNADNSILGKYITRTDLIEFERSNDMTIRRKCIETSQLQHKLSLGMQSVVICTVTQMFYCFENLLPILPSSYITYIISLQFRNQ